MAVVLVRLDLSLLIADQTVRHLEISRRWNLDGRRNSDSQQEWQVDSLEIPQGVLVAAVLVLVFVFAAVHMKRDQSAHLQPDPQHTTVGYTQPESSEENSLPMNMMLADGWSHQFPIVAVS